MAHLKLLLSVLALTAIAVDAQLTIGLGRADVTGPSVEVPFMGYAVPSQRGEGIHTRTYARTFIVQDSAGRRAVFSSVDISGISHAMRRDVIANVQSRLGNIYNINNVMISAQHTHGAAGGYHQYVLYDFTCLGFIRETYNAHVTGIANSIVNAHNSMAPGRVFLSQVNVPNVGMNRSPKAYLLNPASERAQFSGDMDQQLVQLRFETTAGVVRGAFNWMATHAVSMNNENRLISSDNLGLAAMLLEQERNPGQLVGSGAFVGAFNTANSGDISPNIAGPRCVATGLYCDPIESTCPNRDVCIALGPGVNDEDSTRIIGSRMHVAAANMVNARGGRELTGTVGFMHQFLEMSQVTGTWTNPTTNQVENYRGCFAAMGHSFAAGTTDGPGGFDFTQGSTSGNPFWDAVRDFIAPPTADDHVCHAPKPILLNTGRTSRPYLWQPSIVPTQVIRIGDAIIAGLPGEFTTMAGRRVRTAIRAAAGQNFEVILSGMTNIYSSYVVTWEEYQMQRYEAASTPYGPHTLTIMQQSFQRLTTAMMSGGSVPAGPTPPDQSADQMTFLTPVVNDDAGNSFFGAVLAQPLARYNRGQTATATFVSGNPRNDLRLGSSYFFVERLGTNGVWMVEATDANWETRFIWRRTSTLAGRSEIDFRWVIPANAPGGEYRIRHEGTSRGPVSGLRPYSGVTQVFSI